MQQEQSVEPYKYLQIPDKKTIRILTLYPGTSSDRLIGELTFVKLDDHPVYEAISYVWGEPIRCEDFLCEGKSISLTQSLADALRRVRDGSRPRRLWVDQICINQDDQTERSQQVKLMNAIYKDTAKVLVWLGRDNQDCAKAAFDLIKSLNMVFGDDEQLKQFTADQKENLDEFPADAWQPLKVLYHLPWVSTDQLNVHYI